jgi:hypothetical protein
MKNNYDHENAKYHAVFAYTCYKPLPMEETSEWFRQQAIEFSCIPANIRLNYPRTGHGGP